MPASLLLEEELEKYITGTTALATLTKTWLALLTATPEKKWSGTEVEAKQVAGMKRVEISGSEKPGWETKTKAEGATGFTLLVNKNAIAFGTEAFNFKEPTAEGKLEYWAICTTETGGNMLAFGKLKEPLTVNKSSKPEAAAKALELEVE